LPLDLHDSLAPFVIALIDGSRGPVVDLAARH
jgi:hypothetical protein